MSTKLVVNLDLLAEALAAGGAGPQSLLALGEAALEAGADGVALDPKGEGPDWRAGDAASLAAIAHAAPGRLLVLTGAPDDAFLEAVHAVRPDAALFMPAPEAGRLAAAAEAGFNFFDEAEKTCLALAIGRAKDCGARVGLFADPEFELMRPAKDLGADFVLMNADAFSAAAGTPLEDVILGSLFEAGSAAKAAELGLAVGRGLALSRLGAFMAKMSAVEDGLDAVALGAELVQEGGAEGWRRALERAAAFIKRGAAGEGAAC